MFSQIEGVQKSMNKAVFLCFNAASGILHEDLPCFYPELWYNYFD